MNAAAAQAQKANAEPWTELGITEEAWHEREARLSQVTHANQPIIADKEELSQPGTVRKRRSDAGKPRSEIFINLPGVRVDISTAEGRAYFLRGCPKTIGDMPNQAPSVFEQLFAHIDRLRAK